jgi:hypothetical protein
MLIPHTNPKLLLDDGNANERKREREKETSTSNAIAITADVRYGLGVRVGRARSVYCLYLGWQGHPDY